MESFIKSLLTGILCFTYGYWLGRKTMRETVQEELDKLSATCKGIQDELNEP